MISLSNNTAIDESINIRDYLLDIDDIGQPRVLDMNIQPGKPSSGLLMAIRLILMRKGTIPDIPDMGVDINGRYRASLDDPSVLANDIEEQISTYLPEMLPVTVTCTMSKQTQKQVNIILGLNGTTYALAYDPNSSALKYLNSGEDQ